MPRKTAKELYAGAKVRRDDTGEVIKLAYVGRGTIRGTVLIQWNEGGRDKRVNVSPDREFDVV
jgi:hypothetical protein